MMNKRYVSWRIDKVAYQRVTLAWSGLQVPRVIQQQVNICPQLLNHSVTSYLQVFMRCKKYSQQYSGNPYAYPPAIT